MQALRGTKQPCLKAEMTMFMFNDGTHTHIQIQYMERDHYSSLAFPAS